MYALEAVTAGTLGRVAGPCRGCTSWMQAGGGDAGRDARAAWLRDADPRGLGAGWVALDDATAKGHILYLPSPAVPEAQALPTGPPSPGAFVVVGLRLDDDAVGRLLVQRAVADLRRRGARRLEAFAGCERTWRCQGSGHSLGGPCRPPARVLEALGFHVDRPHPTVPRYRLDMHRAVAVGERVRTLGRALRPAALGGDPVLGRDEGTAV